MKKNQSGHSTPDSPSSRMCADTYDKRHKSHRCKTNANLRNVTCARPQRTKDTVFLFAAIGHTQREGTTVVVLMRDLFTLVTTRDFDYLEFASSDQSVTNSDLGMERLWTSNHEPSIKREVRLLLDGDCALADQSGLAVESAF